MTKSFPKQFLFEILGGSPDRVEDKITDNGRWSINHTLVFKAEGKLWQVGYSVGATEQQDESPWEYEKDPIPCTEVKAVEKTVIAYEPV